MKPSQEPIHNLRQAIPFFMVTNMQNSLEFYVRQLGFEIKLKWEPAGVIEWCSIERETVALMLQEYREGFQPATKLGEGVTVCIVCHDALALYHEFGQKGVKAGEPFVGNNYWVVELQDPDGYKILFESPADAPEGTIYSDWQKTGSRSS